MTQTEQQTVRTIIKSVRLNPEELQLIGSECQARKIGFSKFVREAAMKVAGNEQHDPKIGPRDPHAG
jgi:hypothetical protein